MNPQSDNDEKLQSMLLEDTDSAEQASALLATARQLRGWRAPETTVEATNSLVARLVAELPPARQPWSSRVFNAWPVLLLRSQARVVRSEIWLASALVIALGTFVTLTADSAASVETLPLAVLAPIVAAIGIALLYDTDNEPMLELENATPASLRLLLLARLTLVFGFDLALGLAGSVLLAALRSEVSLWPLVMSWLAPMAFLSALGFFLSVVFIDSLAGALFSLGLWGLHIVLRAAQPQNVLIAALSLPGLAAPEMRPLLFALAGALLAVALWLAGRIEPHSGAVS